MDTLFDGESELDEMTFKDERYFECVCTCLWAVKSVVRLLPPLPQPRSYFLRSLIFFFPPT